MQSDVDFPAEYDTGSQTTSTPEKADDSISIRELPKVEQELYGHGKPKRTTIRARIIRDEE